MRDRVGIMTLANRLFCVVIPFSLAAIFFLSCSSSLVCPPSVDLMPAVPATAIGLIFAAKSHNQAAPDRNAGSTPDKNAL